MPSPLEVDCAYFSSKLFAWSVDIDHRRPSPTYAIVRHCCLSQPSYLHGMVGNVLTSRAHVVAGSTPPHVRLLILLTS